MVLKYRQSHTVRQIETNKNRKECSVMNINKLKAKIVERGMNVETLADSVGIDRSSMYRKLNNFDRILIGEAKKIKAALELTDEEATLIFLQD